jgi:hypothetical protein
MEWRLEQTGAGEDVESEIHGSARHCLIFAFILFFLATCITGSIYVTGAGLANFVHTDKLPTDYLANRVLGKKYNLPKLIGDDGPMCRNSFKYELTEKPYYCYQTVLQYNFYETLDPIGSGAERIRKREPSSRRIQG